MAEEEGSKGGLGAIGALGGGLLLALARFGDDCARVGSHAAPAIDDLARVGAEAGVAGKALGEGGALAEAGNAARLGELGGDDAARVVAGLGADDAARIGDDLGHLGGSRFSEDLVHVASEHGLDLVDLGGQVKDLVAEEPTDAPHPRAHPRLVVAHAANPPDPGPIDPLVLLVDPLTDADRDALLRGCTLPEQRCVVLECGDDPCVTGWRETWTTLGKDEALVGHPEAIADALVLTASADKRLRGAPVTTGTPSPTGVRTERRVVGG